MRLIGVIDNQGAGAAFVGLGGALSQYSSRGGRLFLRTVPSRHFVSSPRGLSRWRIGGFLPALGGVKLVRGHLNLCARAGRPGGRSFLGTGREASSPPIEVAHAGSRSGSVLGGQAQYEVGVGLGSFAGRVFGNL